MPSATSNVIVPPARRRTFMKFALLALAAAAISTGCTTPRQDYIAQHPELSPEHRKIVAAGTFKDHDPVAGMTRDAVRLTMGTDPAQVTKVNGEDAWIWIKKKGDSLTMMDESNHSGGPGSGTFSGLPPENDHEPKKRSIVRTTVFFRGDTATRVDVTEEVLGGSNQ